MKEINYAQINRKVFFFTGALMFVGYLSLLKTTTVKAFNSTCNGAWCEYTTDSGNRYVNDGTDEYKCPAGGGGMCEKIKDDPVKKENDQMSLRPGGGRCTANPIWNADPAWYTPEIDRILNPDKAVFSFYPVDNWGAGCNKAVYRLYIAAGGINDFTVPNRPNTPYNSELVPGEDGILDTTNMSGEIDHTFYTKIDNYLDPQGNRPLYWWVEANNGSHSTFKGPFRFRAGPRLRCKLEQVEGINYSSSILFNTATPWITPALNPTIAALHNAAALNLAGYGYGASGYGSSDDTTYYHIPFLAQAYINGQPAAAVDQNPNRQVGIELKRTTTNAACWYGDTDVNSDYPPLNCPANLFNPEHALSQFVNYHDIGISKSESSPNTGINTVFIRTVANKETVGGYSCGSPFLIQILPDEAKGKTIKLEVDFKYEANIRGDLVLSKYVKDYASKYNYQQIKSYWPSSENSSLNQTTGYYHFISENIVLDNTPNTYYALSFYASPIMGMFGEGSDYSSSMGYFRNPAVINVQSGTNLLTNPKFVTSASLPPVPRFFNSTFENIITDLLSYEKNPLNFPLQKQWYSVFNNACGANYIYFELKPELQNIGDEYLVCNVEQRGFKTECLGSPFTINDGGLSGYNLKQDCGLQSRLLLSRTGVETVKISNMRSPTQSGNNKSSQRTTEEAQGTNWFNPVKISTRVNKGFGNMQLKSLYYFFTDKSLGPSVAYNLSLNQIILNMENVVKTYPNKAFLVRFDYNANTPTNSTYFVYNNRSGTWQYENKNSLPNGAIYDNVASKKIIYPYSLTAVQSATQCDYRASNGDRPLIFLEFKSTLATADILDSLGNSLFVEPKGMYLKFCSGLGQKELYSPVAAVYSNNTNSFIEIVTDSSLIQQ